MIEPMAVMDKRQLIDDIRKYNVTARPQFLAQFDEAALRQYLNHLEDAVRHREEITAGVRPGPRPKFRLVS